MPKITLYSAFPSLSFTYIKFARVSCKFISMSLAHCLSKFILGSSCASPRVRCQPGRPSASSAACARACTHARWWPRTRPRHALSPPSRGAVRHPGTCCKAKDGTGRGGISTWAGARGVGVRGRSHSADFDAARRPSPTAPARRLRRRQPRLSATELHHV